MAKVIKIGDELTKEQEKQLITNFIAALPADSYLVAILRGVDTEANMQIENDWGISIIESRDHAQREASEHKETAEKIGKRLQVEQDTGKQFREERDAKAEEVYGLNTRIAEMTKAHQNALDDLKNFHKAQIDDLIDKQEAADFEINRLKVKLFDLAEKAGAI